MEEKIDQISEMRIFVRLYSLAEGKEIASLVTTHLGHKATLHASLYLEDFTFCEQSSLSMGDQPWDHLQDKAPAVVIDNLQKLEPVKTRPLIRHMLLGKSIVVASKLRHAVGHYVGEEFQWRGQGHSNAP